MSRIGARLLALGAVMLLTATPGRAQEGEELGLQVTSLLREHSYYGIGISAAHRTGGRARIAFGGLYGVAGEEQTVRGEFAGHFMASPARRGGVGLYAIGGAGFEAGWRNQGYVILGLGLESHPGGGSGFHLEAGVGGGFRVSAGWRARWLGANRSRIP